MRNKRLFGLLLLLLVSVGTLAGAQVAREPAVQTQVLTRADGVTYSASTAAETKAVAGTTPSATNPPIRRVLWGAATAQAPKHHGTESREEEARYLEARIGRTFDMTRHYLGGPTVSWTGDAGMAATVASGRIPAFSFRAGWWSWRQIANGAADTALRARFNEFLNAKNALWRTAIIGFENEPENQAATKGSAADYRAAVDHMVGLAQRMGLPNTWTTWLMVPTWRGGRDAVYAESWVPQSVYYLGVHGYGTAVDADTEDQCRTGVTAWREFVPYFTPPHNSAVKLGKRMIVGEIAQREHFLQPSSDGKAAWIRSIPVALARLPRIDAVLWWHSGGGEGPFPGECDYKRSFRIDSTAKSLQAYADAGHAAIFGG
jgi:hypothetical protein